MKNILKNTNGSVLEPLEKGQEYFHISILDMTVKKYEWVNDNFDFNLMIFSNVFLTQREAEKALEQMQ